MAEKPVVYTLEREHELRIEVTHDQVLMLELKEGTAEIFGIEVAPLKQYSFSDVKFAVFTWYGCTIHTIGRAEVAYVQGDTPMVSYVNTHAQLEARRDVAMEALTANANNNGAGGGAGGQKVSGPRVILTGPIDSGKSSLAAILTAYAVRLGRSPTYIDLDIGQGQLTVPGTIAAASIDSSTLSIEEGFSLAAPLVYYYGHTDLSDNPELYKRLINRLAECVDERLANDAAANAAGVIINTCGWVTDIGLQLLQHAISALSVDIILVLGDDRLYANMGEFASSPAIVSKGKDVRVVKLDKSAGVVYRDPKFRRSSRSKRVREYFYGSAHPKTLKHKGLPPPLSPSMQEIKFDDVKIFKYGSAQRLSDAMLPVGQASLLGPMLVSQVNPGPDMLNGLLGVCHPVLREDGTHIGQRGGDDGDDDDEEALTKALLQSNIAGFLYVTDMDLDRRRMTCLTPCPGALPSVYLIAGNIKWME